MIKIRAGADFLQPEKPLPFMPGLDQYQVAMTMGGIPVLVELFNSSVLSSGEFAELTLAEREMKGFCSDYLNFD